MDRINAREPFAKSTRYHVTVVSGYRNDYNNTSVRVLDPWNGSRLWEDFNYAYYGQEVKLEVIRK